MTTAVTYGWKVGSRVRLDAQKAGEYLTELEQREGFITPATVLQDAEHADSLLHCAIEWDDAAAARAHRLEQAAYILRSLVIVRVGEARPPVRAFVTVREQEGGHFVGLYRALGDVALRRQVLERALRELDQWRVRYEEYEELAAIFAAREEIRLPG